MKTEVEDEIGLQDSPPWQGKAPTMARQGDGESADRQIWRVRRGNTGRQAQQRA